MLCPSRGKGGVAGADYPPLVAPEASVFSLEDLECDPSSLEPKSTEDDELVWDAKSSVRLVRSTKPDVPLVGPFAVPLGGVLADTLAASWLRCPP